MKRTCLLVFLLFVGLTASANAAVTYELFFRSPGLTEQNNAFVLTMPGERFTPVDILIREITTGTDVGVLATENISSFNFSASATGGDGFFDSLVADGSGGFGTNPQPGGGTFSFFAFGPGFGSPGKASTLVSPGVREVRLGTFNLIAPTIGSTTFDVVRGNNDPGDIGTFQTPGLSNVSDATGGFFREGRITLTAIAVPEPSSVILLGMATVLGCVWRRRRSSGRSIAA